MLQRPFLSLLLLICFFSLFAYFAVVPRLFSDTSLPVLPNLLVQVEGEVEGEGEVEVIRKGKSDILVPISLGAELEPGDTLMLKSGQAAIFCGDETSWDTNPISLPVGRHFKVTCSKGRVPFPEETISFVRSVNDSISQHIPYALSPRSGIVLSDRPTLRWDLVPGFDTYTVTLSSSDGKTRPPVSVSGNILSYPENWPALEANDAAYSLRVEGEVQRTDDGKIDGEGFSLLAADKAQQVRDFEERLREHNLSQPSEALLLAHLYLNEEYNLHSEAVELLLDVPNGDQIAAVQRLLGQTYLEMDLLHEAIDAYSQALSLAEDANLPEEQATAHIKLGLLACIQKDQQETNSHRQKAKALYEQMGWSEEDVEVLLAEEDEKCR